VAPRGREVDVFQVPVQQERPPRGGRRPRDEAAGGPAGLERPAQRRRWDDPGAGPSQAPPVAAGADEDLVRRFETVFRDVPEGMCYNPKLHYPCLPGIRPIHCPSLPKPC
jgi:hypothetical protein